jgi:hypothetical protein
VDDASIYASPLNQQGRQLLINSIMSGDLSGMLSYLSDLLVRAQKKLEEEKKRKEAEAFQAVASASAANALAMSDLANAMSNYKDSHKGDLNAIQTGLAQLTKETAQLQGELSQTKNTFQRGGQGALDLNQVPGIDKNALGLTGTHYVVARDINTRQYFVFDDQGNKRVLPPEQQEAVDSYLRSHPKSRVINTSGNDQAVKTRMMQIHELADNIDARNKLIKAAAEFTSSKDRNDALAKDVEPLLKRFQDAENQGSLTPHELAKVQTFVLLQNYEQQFAAALRDPSNMTKDEIERHTRVLMARDFLLKRAEDGTLTPDDVAAAKAVFERNNDNGAEKNQNQAQEREAPAPTPPRPLNELSGETLANIMEQVRASREDGGYGLKLSKREIEHLAAAHNISPTELESAIAERHPDIKIEGHGQEHAPNQNPTPDVAVHTPSALSPEQMRAIMSSIRTLNV